MKRSRKVMPTVRLRIYCVASKAKCIRNDLKNSESIACTNWLTPVQRNSKHKHHTITLRSKPRMNRKALTRRKLSYLVRDQIESGRELNSITPACMEYWQRRNVVMKPS